MAKIFKVFQDFYTGILDNIYNMLDAFDGIGGEAVAKIKDAIGKILGKVAEEAAEAAEAE